jgi:hypothetical protein
MDSTFPLVSRKKWLLFTFVILLYCIFLSGSKKYKHKGYVNPFAFYRSQNISSNCKDFASATPPARIVTRKMCCAVRCLSFGDAQVSLAGTLEIYKLIYRSLSHFVKGPSVWLEYCMGDERQQESPYADHGMYRAHSMCISRCILYAWHGNDVPRKGFERILMHRHIAIDDIVDSTTGLTAFGLGTCPVSKCVCWPELRFIPDLPWNLQFPLSFLGSEGDGLRTLYCPSWRSGSLLLESQTWP